MSLLSLGTPHAELSFKVNSKPLLVANEKLESLALCRLVDNREDGQTNCKTQRHHPDRLAHIGSLDQVLCTLRVTYLLLKEKYLGEVVN